MTTYYAADPQWLYDPLPPQNMHNVLAIKYKLLKNKEVMSNYRSLTISEKRCVVAPNNPSFAPLVAPPTGNVPLITYQFLIQ